MRKNIKKLAAVGLTAVLGAGLLAGCGGDGKSSGGSKDGKVELVMSVWDSDQQPVMEKMAEATTRNTRMCMLQLSLLHGLSTGQSLRHLQQAEAHRTSSQ